MGWWKTALSCGIIQTKINDLKDIIAKIEDGDYSTYAPSKPNGHGLDQ